MAAGKKLSERQLKKLHENKNSTYVVGGNITGHWWIYNTKLDKYLGGYVTKEEAEGILNSGEYLNAENLWLTGNSTVI